MADLFKMTNAELAPVFVHMMDELGRRGLPLAEQIGEWAAKLDDDAWARFDEAIGQLCDLPVDGR